MAQHNILGVAGETAAAEYLITLGLTIRERNWKMGHLEVDIIAEKDGKYHFVEVKTRHFQSKNYNPLTAINAFKQQNIINASKTYCKCYHLPWNVQYDVIVVYGEPGSFQVNYYPKYRMEERPHHTGPRRFFPKSR